MRYRIFKVNHLPQERDQWGERLPAKFILEEPELGFHFRDTHPSVSSAEEAIRNLKKEERGFNAFVILPVYEFDYEGNEVTP